MTCVESGHTIVYSGYVRQIHADALNVECADRTISAIRQFLDFRIADPPENHVGLSDSLISEWSGVSP